MPITIGSRRSSFWPSLPHTKSKRTERKAYLPFCGKCDTKNCCFFDKFLFRPVSRSQCISKSSRSLSISSPIHSKSHSLLCALLSFLRFTYTRCVHLEKSYKLMWKCKQSAPLCTIDGGRRRRRGEEAEEEKAEEEMKLIIIRFSRTFYIKMCIKLAPKCTQMKEGNVMCICGRKNNNKRWHTLSLSRSRATLIWFNYFLSPLIS